jgi:colanic acid/amylovoran biosynthesis glycosyltransferase
LNATDQRVDAHKAIEHGAAAVAAMGDCKRVIRGVTDEPVSSLLLILPLVVHQRDGRVFIENQAGNGLAQWLRHFARMTLGVKLAAGAAPPAGSVAIDTLGLGDRLSVVLLPTAWTPLGHLRAYPSIRRRLRDLIDRHDYLQFALGGAWGDWGAVGALLAAKKERKASVWTDRVESEVMRIEAQRFTGLKRLYRGMNARLARSLERRAISRSTLGLFHGNDTFNSYRGFSPHPFLVHNIHLKPADRIPDERLSAKIAAAREGVLDIVYAGRVHPDKGVTDWIETLRLAADAGVPFRARWFGDGPQLDEARATVDRLGLADRISFPGQLVDRDALLEALRDAHVMLFCHLTPESPRCLIEALVSGTPIVGYGSAYPEDLIAEHGGGVLTAMAPAALARELVRLDGDRAVLAALIGQAAQDGRDMNDEAVFAHRAHLMKQYCSTGAPGR